MYVYKVNRVTEYLFRLAIHKMTFFYRLFRTDHSANSFLSYSNLATDRGHHHNCDPPMLMRPSGGQSQMLKKLSTSAPLYSWSFTAPYQQQHQQQHQQQPQLLIPKQEDYSPFMSGPLQFQQQQQQQQQLLSSQLMQPIHPTLIHHPSSNPPEIHLIENLQCHLEDQLPSAEDLLGDPTLRPLGIEPLLPIDHNQEHLISSYCNTPLFGSSIMESPLSTSLLNTPVATPGKVLPNILAHPTMPGTVVVVVKEQPPPTPDPNEVCIKKVSQCSSLSTLMG